MDGSNSQDFQGMSKSVAERFLQTVVVLDDGAYMIPVEVPQTVVEPEEDVAILEEPEDGAGGPADPQATPTNALDAQTLIIGFAKHGLVCAVLAPLLNEDGSEATVRASRRADIVILDWQLGDHGERAKAIIREIIEQDASAGGRVRMMVVYTASLDLEAARSAVAADLAEFKAIDRPGGILALGTRQSRVLFVSKGKTSDTDGRVEEAHLPARLIEEFAEMTKGLLSNVSLGSIAALRDETHHMLARFHRGLDAPFLTHRMLLASPEDAEAYAVDLVTSEFIATLQGKRIGSAYADREAIQAALVETQQSGFEFRIMTAKNAVASAKTVSADNLMKLVDSGPSGLADIPSFEGTTSQQEKLHERLYVAFSKSIEESVASNHEFARLSAHARERARVRDDFQARLDLGTIVQTEEEYLVCVQPTCDTLRLQEATQFLFAVLAKSKGEFDLVVQDESETDIRLKLNSKISAIRALTFEPDVAKATVLSSAKGEEGAFTCVSGQKYLWLCDLRASFAQRFVHRIATDLSRIGLDEFEWQRRHAPRGQ